ncbi:hypothetical protein [Pelagibius sp. Alg239-R121]|uniref:hypothetical protein n=1 Tax=Pelagibius sp. Alg239-R121 TaxID=2993448 RepID=UPI0024A66719|nr:hypothetical protein [Pelagibius sp. Alg239-R121]
MLIRFFCYLLAFSAPFSSFLVYHDYLEFRSEVAGIFVLFVVFALLLTAVNLFQNLIFSSVIYGGIVVVFCDFAFAEMIKQDSLVLSLVILFAVFLVSAFAARFITKACWPALLAFLLVFLISSVVVPQQQQAEDSSTGLASAEGNPSLPPVIHIILDEHLGLDGFPPDMPESAAVRTELLGFFHRWGFRAYTQAFSEEFATKNSLRNLFAAQSGPESMDKLGEDDIASVAGDALRDMSAQGYRFVVEGIDHANLCNFIGFAGVECRNYEALSIRTLKDMPLPSWQKTLVIAGNYLKQSTLYKIALNVEILAFKQLQAAGITIPIFDAEAYSLSTLSSFRHIDKIIGDVPQIKDGEYRIYHLVIPHFPYALKADCSIREVSNWQSYDSLLTATFNSLETRREKYPLYIEQLRCLYARLDVLMQRLRESGLEERAAILLHGDHGSRITVNLPPDTPRARITDTDLVDSYSTLFAVRAPGLKAGVDRSRVSIQKLFPAFTGSAFSALPAPEVTGQPPLLNLRGKPSHRWIEMPNFGMGWYKNPDREIPEP